MGGYDGLLCDDPAGNSKVLEPDALLHRGVSVGTATPSTPKKKKEQEKKKWLNLLLLPVGVVEGAFHEVAPRTEPELLVLVARREICDAVACGCLYVCA